MRFIDAIVCLGYAALIHESDAAVRKTAKMLVKRVDSRHKKAIMEFHNHPRPLIYTRVFCATLPDRIIYGNFSSVVQPSV